MSEILAQLEKKGGGGDSTKLLYHKKSVLNGFDISFDTTKSILVNSATAGGGSNSLDQWYTPNQVLASSSSNPFASLTYGNQTLKVFYVGNKTLRVQATNLPTLVIISGDGE